MLKEKIEILRKKLEEQISNEVEYKEVYETSTKLDKLIIKYYINDMKNKIDLKGIRT